MTRIGDRVIRCERLFMLLSFLCLGVARRISESLDFIIANNRLARKPLCVVDQKALIVQIPQNSRNSNTRARGYKRADGAYT